MNTIRKERTKELYIQTVCDIIRTDGMSSVTIRNVSDIVGYNSATMYSYFRNLPDLILCAHMRFEEELLGIFQKYIAENEIEGYFDIWPHMYAIMAKYYLSNPNIFDCSFISDFAGTEHETMITERYKESVFQQYVQECLLRIAQETGKDMDKIFQINMLCLAQVTGIALLFTRGRFGIQDLPDWNSFEENIKKIIYAIL